MRMDEGEKCGIGSCSESKSFLGSFFSREISAKESGVLIYFLLLVESYGKLISATAGSLSTGTASSFSGQHDVGHKGVATGSGVLSLYSFVAQSGCFGSVLLSLRFRRK